MTAPESQAPPTNGSFFQPRRAALDSALIVLKLPVGGVESSMTAREMMDCGSVALKLACVGATAAAVPRSALMDAVVAAQLIPCNIKAFA